jgi:hypothetical protein
MLCVVLWCYVMWRDLTCLKYWRCLMLRFSHRLILQGLTFKGAYLLTVSWPSRFFPRRHPNHRGWNIRERRDLCCISDRQGRGIHATRGCVRCVSANRNRWVQMQLNILHRVRNTINQMNRRRAFSSLFLPSMMSLPFEHCQEWAFRVVMSRLVVCCGTCPHVGPSITSSEHSS